VTEEPVEDPGADPLRGAIPRLSRYVRCRPTPRQAAFLLVPAAEAFYGGAAGGGKSIALLMAALAFADVGSYAAVLVRQTYAMLAQPGGLMDVASAWLAPTDAAWNATEHQWRFPSGATLTFRHLQDSGAERNFQGAEYQFIGIDEVTDFPEEQYRFLFSRLRRARSSGVPLRMRAASNPYGPGLEWCHRRFVVEGRAHGRVFIPARLEDNPYLDAETYDQNLRKLGPVAYRQLRHGDWTVRPDGGLFKAEWLGGRFVDDAELPKDLALCRYWDLAATEVRRGTDPDYTAGVLLGREPKGRWFVIDVARTRASPLEVERLVARVAEADAAWAQGRKMAPPAIRMEQEPGSAGVAVIDHYRREVLGPHDFRGVRSTGSKETRAAPVAARVQGGDVFLCRGGWNTEFLDELVSFPSGSHDDQVDALSGAYGALAGVRPMVVPSPVSIDEPSYWLSADAGW
jgi:predicted phage terminase large subunit-like protein